jgi:hypothetical protein
VSELVPRLSALAQWGEMRMTDNVKISVTKIETDTGLSRQQLTVTTKIGAPSLDFELVFQVKNTGNPQDALEEVRQRLFELGNGIATAAGHPLVM